MQQYETTAALTCEVERGGGGNFLRNISTTKQFYVGCRVVNWRIIPPKPNLAWGLINCPMGQVENNEAKVWQYGHDETWKMNFLEEMESEQNGWLLSNDFGLLHYF